MKFALSLILVASVASVFAQDSCVAEAKAKPFAASIGLGKFNNSGTGDFTKDSAMAFGLTYRPGMPCMAVPGKGVPGFDLTYYGVSGNGNRITTLGLGPATRIYLDDKMSFYGGFGIGAYSTSVKKGAVAAEAGKTGRATGDNVAAGSKTMVRAGAKLLLGYAGKSGEFFEVGYHLLSKTRGVDTSYATFSVGFKF